MVPLHGSQTLLSLMRDARLAAELQMSVFESEGEEYEETAITSQLLAMTRPLTRFVKFNQVQEGRWTGADWIWWWVEEGTGESFGAVIQAKRLKKKSSRWWVDFAYKDNQQRRDLMWLGDFYQIVPLYALYLGTSNYRSGAFCRSHDGHAEDCQMCRMSTLSVVPAMLTREGGASEFDQTAMALTSHLSLEELVDPSVDPIESWTQDFTSATEAFMQFMREPQTGSRDIAKKIVKQIEYVRGLQHSLVEEGVAITRSDAVFPQLPDAATHLNVQYFPHALAGLRTAPPDYVQEFLRTGELSNDLPNVGGLAVTTIPANNAR